MLWIGVEDRGGVQHDKAGLDGVEYQVRVLAVEVSVIGDRYVWIQAAAQDDLEQVDLPHGELLGVLLHLKKTNGL